MLHSTEPMLIDDPTESAEANAPMLPTLANDPTLPIESMEPSEAIERNELRDHSDKLRHGGSFGSADVRRMTSGYSSRRPGASRQPLTSAVVMRAHAADMKIAA